MFFIDSIQLDLVFFILSSVSESIVGVFRTFTFNYWYSWIKNMFITVLFVVPFLFPLFSFFSDFN